MLHNTVACTAASGLGSRDTWSVRPALLPQDCVLLRLKGSSAHVRSLMPAWFRQQAKG